VRRCEAELFQQAARTGPIAIEAAPITVNNLSGLPFAENMLEKKAYRADRNCSYHDRTGNAYVKTGVVFFFQSGDCAFGDLHEIGCGSSHHSQHRTKLNDGVICDPDLAMQNGRNDFQVRAACLIGRNSSAALHNTQHYCFGWIHWSEVKGAHDFIHPVLLLPRPFVCFVGF